MRHDFWMVRGPGQPSYKGQKLVCVQYQAWGVNGSRRLSALAVALSQLKRHFLTGSTPWISTYTQTYALAIIFWGRGRGAVSHVDYPGQFQSISRTYDQISGFHWRQRDSSPVFTSLPWLEPHLAPKGFDVSPDRAWNGLYDRGFVVFQS